jgi:hypothetical protein
LLAYGRWFSSSTTKTGRHDIAEILLKVALNTKNQGKLWFVFRSEISFFLSRKARIFFPEFDTRLYDKNSESDYFFSSTKIRIFFQQN